jgi:hypothetical protein
MKNNLMEVDSPESNRGEKLLQDEGPIIDFKTFL